MKQPIKPFIARANGAIEYVEPDKNNGTEFSLELMQSIVDGYIEIVYIKDGNIMVVNDECNLDDTYEYNLVASMLAMQQIKGDVLVCPSDMVK